MNPNNGSSDPGPATQVGTGDAPLTPASGGRLPRAVPWTVGLTLAALMAAILLWITQCTTKPAEEADAGAEPGTTTTDTTLAAAGPQDHTEAFKKFIMIDRNGAPDWFQEVLAVRYTPDGTLTAETSLRAGWRDTSRPSRPVESICTNLFAYGQRGAKLPWKALVVLAADGSTLIKRTDPTGSCRQT